MSEKKNLSIYGYSDYRAYLRDFYEFKKSNSNHYSFRSFSKSAGFTSPNILKLVMDGERNIGDKALEQFAKGLGLVGGAREYFFALVRMNQASADAEKEQWLAELKRLTPYAQKRQLANETTEYLSHWLYPVLREMISQEDFRADPYWIARRLVDDVTPSQVKDAWEFLLKSGFIRRDEAGVHHAVDQMVLSSDEVSSLAVRNFHRQMLSQSEKTLEKLPMSDREFGALTFVLPESAIDELKFRMKAFRRDLHLWALEASKAAQSNMTVQVNMQMFPHTRKVTP